MGRNETVLLEHNLGMRRLDVSRNKGKRVKNDQTEEKVGPSSYISIVVEGQDEHVTIRRNGCAKFSKKNSTDENRPFYSLRVWQAGRPGSMSVIGMLRQLTSGSRNPQDLALAGRFFR